MEIIITEQKAELAVVYKERASMDNLTAVMDKGLNMAYDLLKELGKQPAGAPFCCYTNMSEDFSAFDLELGFPVTEEIPVKGELQMSKTLAGKALTATHKGSYASLETTYTAMMQYVADNSLEMKGIYYDWYLNDPDNTTEDELLTKVVFLIKMSMNWMELYGADNQPNH